MTVFRMGSPKPGTVIRIRMSHTGKPGYTAGVEISVFEGNDKLPKVSFPIEWMTHGQVLELMIDAPMNVDGPAGAKQIDLGKGPG